MMTVSMATDQVKACQNTRKNSAPLPADRRLALREAMADPEIAKLSDIKIACLFGISRQAVHRHRQAVNESKEQQLVRRLRKLRREIEAIERELRESTVNVDSGKKTTSRN